jgi:trehalose synthase
MKRVAQDLPKIKADYWVIHDPQVLPLIDYIPHGQPTVWRCHIDTSHPNPDFWKFIKPFVKKYDKIIFSLKDYVHNGTNREKIEIVQPAIDPLLPKNSPMSARAGKMFLKRLGIDPKRPLVAQISRFDPWKDPEGVVKAYKLAKKQIPELQLAYFGLKIAKDDPEADEIYARTKRIAGKDPDCHLIFDPKVLGRRSFDSFVQASQSAADVILQKSTREGFGLTVAEGMWKSKPVIGGRVGGDPLAD